MPKAIQLELDLEIIQIEMTQKPML